MACCEFWHIWKGEHHASGGFRCGRRGSGTITCEWLGDFFLRGDAVYTSPLGSYNALQIMGYDADEKAYTWHRYFSYGKSDSFKGSVKNHTRTSVSEEQPGWRSRCTMIEESEDVITFKWERSPEGGPWEPSLEFSAMRVR